MAILPPYFTQSAFEHAIKQAYAEDIGDGDHSSLACIDPNSESVMELKVKQTAIIAGIEVARLIYQLLAPNTHFEAYITDGEKIESGEVAFKIIGNSIELLSLERLVLNIMQRMSGIATTTHQYKQAIAHTKAQLLDTRKTTPNFRIFEKYAVIIGGGQNHRFGLYDMVMLKDNHIDMAGGIEAAIAKTVKYLREKNLDLKIEIEVRNINELTRVIEIGNIDQIMLDNFSITQTHEAVAINNGRYKLEASGNITLQTIGSVAETGIDFISSGAIIHSAPNIDLSLKVVK